MKLPTSICRCLPERQKQPKMQHQVSSTLIFRCRMKTLSSNAASRCSNSLLRNFLQQLVTLSTSKPPPSILIVGQSLGGCVAMLFTFWLLKSLEFSKVKHRLLCISFGSPLLGDEKLQSALEYSSWKYCFLNVASTNPRPQLFQPSDGSSIIYKPFGTFLICSDSGCSCSEDPDFIIEHLFSSNSHNLQNQNFDVLFDYGKILEALRSKAMKASCTHEFIFTEMRNALQACSMLQLIGIGVLLPMPI